MKSKFFFTVMALLMVLCSVSSAQVPQLINYQGKLTNASGAPVNDTVQMVFTIYADSNGITSKWSETQTGVKVDKGVFNVLLGSVNPIPDSVFNGNVRYLGVKVGGDPEITPRKKMVSVAYAYKAFEADTANYARAGAGDNDWVFPTSAGGTNPRPYLYTYGAWGIARYGNTLYGNEDSTHVNLGVACTTGANMYDHRYCTVGGGFGNSASNEYATVGGGYKNTASNNYGTTVAGGFKNSARAFSSTIGGGFCDTATGESATVGGGELNRASSNYSTVGGGRFNTASGLGATVPGGYADTAAGDYSFATGNLVRLTSAADYTFAFGSNFTTSASHAVIFHDTDTPIKVGIGTTSPTTTLHVQGDGLVKSTGGSVALSGGDGAMEIWGTDGAFIDLKDSEGEDYDFRITQIGGTNNLGLLGGNVGIGHTSPTEKLDVNGTARLRSMSTGTGTDVVVDANGVLLKKSSSIRYKQNIRRLDSTPDQILQLNPVRFDWKTTGEADIGLIAEEVEKAVPDLVIYDKEGKPDAVKYDKITVYLLEVVKTQQEQIDALKAKLDQLESNR